MGKKRRLEAVFAELGENPDLEHLIVDSTVVRAHQRAVGAKRGEDEVIGRSRRGLSMKISIAVDALGHPGPLHPDGRQVADAGRR